MVAMESNNIAKTARGIETGGGGERDACLVVTEMRQRQIGERKAARARAGRGGVQNKWQAAFA